jgi:hypothetical protein
MPQLKLPSRPHSLTDLSAYKRLIKIIHPSIRLLRTPFKPEVQHSALYLSKNTMRHHDKNQLVVLFEKNSNSLGTKTNELLKLIAQTVLTLCLKGLNF